MTRRLVGACIAAFAGWQLAAPPPDRYFESNGVRIRFVEQGSGAPVVLIHGFTGTLDRHWIAPGVFADLARDHRVIAMDARGHGKSGKPRDPAQYGAEMSRDVVRLLDHLKIDRAHIVGYSMGGSIAARMLTMDARRAASVVFVASDPVYAWDDSEAEAWARDLESDTPFLRMMSTLTPADAKLTEDEMRQAAARLAGANDVKALAAYFRGVGGLRVTAPDLAAARVPMLAIIGSRDPMTAGARELGRLIPEMPVIVLDGAEHGGERGLLRRPEFLPALRAFVAKAR